LFFTDKNIAKFYRFGQGIKHFFRKKIQLLLTLDKMSLCARIKIYKPRETKMKTSGVFLPFWQFFAAVFMWYLFVDTLQKMGLVKTK